MIDKIISFHNKIRKIMNKDRKYKINKMKLTDKYST